jgi:transposase-like protein
VGSKFTQASALGRFPPEVDEIQVNFCRNTACENFGMPEILRKAGPGKQAKGTPPPRYVLSSKHWQTPYFKCKACGQKFPLKSNAAISEEYRRISKYLIPPEDPCCNNVWCKNHTVPATSGPKFYYLNDRRNGAVRYVCRECGGSVTVRTTPKKRKDSSSDRQMFLDIVAEKNIRNITRNYKLSRHKVYLNIDYYYKLCQEFMASRERRLIYGQPIKRLEIGVDCQRFLTNWTRSEDRRNTELYGIMAADNISGYVFPISINYEPDADAELVEENAEIVGDHNVPYAFRKYARLWLQSDYEESKERYKANKKYESPPKDKRPNYLKRK